MEGLLSMGLTPSSFYTLHMFNLFQNLTFLPERWVLPNYLECIKILFLTMGGGGVSQFLFFSDKGGGGGSQFLIFG